MSEIPKWMIDIGWNFDRLICHNDRQEYVRKTVDQWIAGRIGKGSKKKRSQKKKSKKISPIVYNEPLIPIPKRELTITEKYVIMAAVHDTACKGVAPLGPLSRESDEVSGKSTARPPSKKKKVKDKITKCAFDYMKKCIVYTILVDHHVERLSDKDEPALMAIFEDVKEDMAAHTLNANDRRPPRRRGQPKRGGQQKYDPLRDEKLINNWRSGGLTQADFEKEKGLASGTIGKAVDRHRKR